MAAWQAVGIHDVNMIALNAATCDGFLSLRLRGVSCDTRPRLCSECYADGGRGNPSSEERSLVVRNSLRGIYTSHANEQALYNNLGLVYAQAAGYGVVAFVDLDERPGAFPMAGAIRRLRTSQPPVPLILAFMHSNVCTACPTSLSDFRRGGSCASANLGGAAKPIGVPHLLSWVQVHDAYEHGRTPSLVPSTMGYDYRTESFAFATCLLHPVPVLGGDHARKAARYWNGSGWNAQPLRAFTSFHETPPELYGWGV